MSGIFFLWKSVQKILLFKLNKLRSMRYRDGIAEHHKKSPTYVLRLSGAFWKVVI